MINVSKIDNNYVVSFNDEVSRLNTLISSEVEQILLELISYPDSSLILDLEGINFIDSTGFNTIKSLINSAKEYNTKFQLKNINDEVMELIELVDLSNIIMLIEN